ncbi:hypothetical protein CPAR01_09485 [Colletotrichum paranaense]|uniref:Uncharacterized protein n=1 Tax=Colletotrichum paranaense TaxID=1914294 RepID=A0ABQ9SGW9_9PEZI|nr:uncharacterized protein CPAR01_09485 [Colletotrichum paranaense]KAK1535943.1 hypothetical protein CPAR01_09485 [Colletotrichum paranaense]
MPIDVTRSAAVRVKGVLQFAALVAVFLCNEDSEMENQLPAVAPRHVDSKLIYPGLTCAKQIVTPFL